MFRMTQRRRPLRAVGIICLMLLQALFPCMSTAQVGQGAGGSVPPGVIVGVVNSLSGPVFMRLESGAEVPLRQGDRVSSRAVIRTGASAELILLFADGQHVSLSENSELRIDEYRFNSADSGGNRASFTLLSGTIRLVTGAMHAGNREALSVRAGEAVIGLSTGDITSFVARLGSGAPEAVDVVVVIGEVSFRTPVGTIASIGQDQFSRWQPGVVPTQPLPLAAAPAILQAIARAPVLPEGAPLDVNAAAELAKLLASLPATAAGQSQPIAVAEVIFPPVTPGGTQGCVGSPC